MTIFWNGIGMVISGLAAVLVLKETRKEFTPYVLLTVCILVFLSVLPVLQETADWFQSLADGQPYMKTVLKAAGISMLTEVGCEICKASGENGMAGYAAMVGRAEILLMTFPIFRELTEMALGFLR